MVAGLIVGAVSTVSEINAFGAQKSAARAARQAEELRRKRAIRNLFKQKRIASAESIVASITSGLGTGSSLVQSAQDSIEAQSKRNLYEISEGTRLANREAEMKSVANQWMNISNFSNSLFSDGGLVDRYTRFSNSTNLSAGSNINTSPISAIGQRSNAIPRMQITAPSNIPRMKIGTGNNINRMSTPTTGLSLLNTRGTRRY